MRAPLVVSILALLTLALPLAPAEGGVDWSQSDACVTAAAEARAGGGVLHRRFQARAGLEVAVDLLCDVAVVQTTLPTDCSRATYGLTGYRWNEVWSARVDPAGSNLPAAGVLDALRTGAETWDGATTTDIFGTMDAGGRGRDAGRYNGVDQIGWKRLGSGTIAVTTTWYYPSTGLAVESDAAYSTKYAWTLGGTTRSYDVQEIGTHELGHTFGLGDLYDPADACLTMYGYGTYGATHARTLGDGDVLGIQAIYGT